MHITGILLLCLMGLCSGCKSGWPAIPLQSETRKAVKAMRTDVQGREISRLERWYKDRTWQYLCSPEGPVQKDYMIWTRFYDVTDGHYVRIPFQSTRENFSGIFCDDYFPVGQESWVGVKGVGAGDILDVSMMVFTKEKITSKFLIPAVLQRKKMRNYDFVNPWKLDEQNKQLLRIDTLTNGTVVFNLQTGEFITGQNLVTKLPIGK